jgi:hypothetical protein
MTLQINDHPLYDLALEEAVKNTPPTLNPGALFKLEHVQEIMATMWIRGVTWGAIHPQQAVSATMWMGERMKEDKGNA